jgi:hypothetical protein
LVSFEKKGFAFFLWLFFSPVQQENGATPFQVLEVK